MEDSSLIINIIYYLAAAIIAVPIFSKLGLGSILGYLIAGIVLGPHVLELVNEPEHVLHFAEFGVVILLFMIGLELTPNKLWKMRYQIGVTGGGQLLLSGLLIGGCVMLSGVDMSVSVLIGLALGLSSTAFAVQLMAEKGILGRSVGRKGFAILLLQDLAVIPILLFVEYLAPASSGGNDNQWWIGIASIAGVLVAGKYLVNPILKVVAGSGSRELMTAASLFIILGVSELMLFAGLSMGLGAFVAGIVLANSSYKHQLEVDLEPFKSILLGLFFIAVGMTINLELLLLSPIAIIGMAIGLLFIKAVVISLIIRLQNVSFRDSISLGIMLGQGGEFAFVVMSSAVLLGVVEGSLAETIILVVSVSMAFTTPALSIFEKLCKTDGGNKSNPDEPQSFDKNEVIIAGFGRFGQIVGRVLSASGIPFSALDKDANHVHFVKNFGGQIYFGDATRVDLLEKAGIENCRLIIVAIDDIGEATSLIKTIKERYPSIKIIARAHNRMHAYQLHDIGCDHVIREMFESSLQGASKALMELGYTEGQALERTDMFRIHDEDLILKNLEHKDDRKKLFEIAHEGRKELEILFKEDAS